MIFLKNKTGATEWTVGKLLTIVLAVVVLALVIYGISINAFSPLKERVIGMYDSVLSLFGYEKNDGSANSLSQEDLERCYLKNRGCSNVLSFWFVNWGTDDEVDITWDFEHNRPILRVAPNGNRGNHWETPWFDRNSKNTLSIIQGLRDSTMVYEQDIILINQILVKDKLKDMIDLLDSAGFRERASVFEKAKIEFVFCADTSSDTCPNTGEEK